MARVSALDVAWEAAHQRWPTIVRDRAAFDGWMAAHVASDDPALYAADFYVTRAAAAGDAFAVAAVDALLDKESARALARLGLNEAARDDVRQTVREKLFLRKNEAEPVIARYSGHGPLGAWLRATLVHAAVSALRAQAREPENVSVSRLPEEAGSDPELAALRVRYGEAFRLAFQEALSTLTPRERNVLRMTYLDGLTADQVGTAYGVHRVSVARWLGDTRSALLERTRAALKERLRLGSDDLSSVTRLCLSQIDVSLERLLLEV